ncbi:MAG: TPMT family class I SAM-dependent methyltransferase [Chitinophagales bacterium]|nr:TPMT family class I SAM-dependent methyltransferase [Chitinophagales bacterium]
MDNNTDKNIKCCTTNCERPLDQNFWNSQWESRQTGWDMGTPSPPITHYMDQFENKEAAILIAGCGNAYEAGYLDKHGFTNITLLDIAPRAVEILKEKFHDNPNIHVVCGDFFEHKGSYDLMIEQTFFCAIPPSRRNEYAQKAASLLNNKGRIIGVLFDKAFEQQGPPFGGCPCEYKPIFSPYFDIKTMEACYNSIPPRAGAEVFINLIKKKR